MYIFVVRPSTFSPTRARMHTSYTHKVSDHDDAAGRRTGLTDDPYAQGRTW